MADTITKKIQIDTNQATANIDKLSKALDKASDNADNLNTSLEQTQETTKTPIPTTPVDNFANSLEKAGEKAETFRTQTDNIQKISAGLAAGFQMAVGSIALFGNENERLTEIMQKLSAVMVMTNSLKALGEGFKGLADYVKIASKEGKLFNNVMKASVIGLVVAAIGYLIANFDDLRKRFTWINTAAEKCTEIFNGLCGVFSNIIPVIKNLGKTVGLALISPIRTIIDGYEAIGKIIKAVFEGDFDKIPDIAKEAVEDIKENFTDVGDAARELGETVADSYNQGVEEGSRKGKRKLTEEELQAIRERQQRIREEQAALEEELRRARLNDKQREYDDLDLWYKKAVEQAHNNKELLLQVEEEYRKRKLGLNDKYNALDRQAEMDRAAQELEDKKNSLANESARNKYEFETGNISELGYTEEELRIAEQQLSLIEEGTAAWYNQAVAVDKLRKKVGELTDTERTENEAKQEMVKSTMGYAQAYGDALNSLFGAIMSGMDENSEAYKGLAITQTIITTLVGMATALSGAFTTKSGPWDIALAAVQAASIMAGGIATVSQIASANENTNPSAVAASVSSSSKVSENAVTSVNSSYNNTQGLPSVTPDSQANADNKVYVTTTDIQKKDRQLNNKRTQVKF